jgi:hypothetical protein
VAEFWQVGKMSIVRNLKGQSHEKVGEVRPWQVSLGSNYEALLVLKFSTLVLEFFSQPNIDSP